jgi:serralysin
MTIPGPASSEFVVNSTTAGDQNQPSVAALAGGRFLSVWVDAGLVKGQFFDKNGIALGQEFLAGTATGNAADPQVAALANGNAAIVWTEQSYPNADGNGAAIKGQVVDPNGNKVGGSFLVNTNPAGDQSEPAVAGLAAGGFVAGWRESGSSVDLQLFDSFGNKHGGELSIPDLIPPGIGAAHLESAVDLVGLPGGGFFGTWLENQVDFGNEFNQHALVGGFFDANGAIVGNPIEIDRDFSGTGPVGLGQPAVIFGRSAPATTLLSNGNVVVTWSEESSTLPGPVPQSFGTFAQILGPTGTKIGGVISIAADQNTPPTEVSPLPGGGFTVLWNGEAQGFDAAGNPLGSAFAQHGTAASAFADGTTMAVAAGNFDGSGAGVIGQILGLFDAVQAGPDAVSPDVLNGTPGADSLSGLAGDDTLNGLGGNDVLIGGAGADAMAGGPGDDLYAVDNAGDVVTEAPGEGIDTVQTQLASTTLAPNVENLVLMHGPTAVHGVGNNLGNTIQGNQLDNELGGADGNDVIRGGTGNDLMYGGADDDVLDGQGGADTMLGGTGNDRYVIDQGDGFHAGDQIIELAAEGIDTVQQDVALLYLPQNVENVVMNLGAVTLVGNGEANTITGNSLANEIGGGDGNDVIRAGLGDDLIYGGANDDVLDGQGGADTMLGGAGNDRYVVDQGDGVGPGDHIIESAGEGIDTVQQDVALFYLPQNVENVVMNLGAVTAVGNGEANTITGNSLANEIGGGDNNDILDGRGGADTLYGGAGNDTFVFQRGEANGDTVVDFVGNGAAPGDTLSFVGYGPGATFTQVDAMHWQVHSGDGLTTETLTFFNSAAINVTDDVLFA